MTPESKWVRVPIGIIEWLIRQGDAGKTPKDGACRDCYGENVPEHVKFRCAYHEAKALLSATPPEREPHAEICDNGLVDRRTWRKP